MEVCSTGSKMTVPRTTADCSERPTRVRAGFSTSLRPKICLVMMTAILQSISFLNPR